MTDELGDRMKMYESAEAGRRCLPLLPVLARLDGRAFHTFTRGLARPFDPRLSELMVETTRALVKESGARTGYTQSDEITLVLWSADLQSQIYFDGRIQKLVSSLAAQATAVFNRLLPVRIPEKADLPADALPTFDCRVWTVPTPTEAANALLWRERDATKNSVSMAARAHYPHAQLLNKSGAEMQELLFAKGVNWNDFPAFFKRGTFVQRRVVRRRFTADERAVLPAMHAARSDPDLEVERTDCVRLDMPPLGRVLNREGVVLFGEEPTLAVG